MIFCEFGSLSSPLSMLLARGIILASMSVAYLLHRRWPSKFTVLLRIAIPFLCLIYWYPETYSFCSIFDYQDHVFAHIDYSIFGCQPSLEFSRVLDSTFWMEFFSMGYYSYYFMMIAMILFYFIARYDDLQRASFVFLASFFLFYLVFDFLPVAGPQYYYCANGVEMGGTAYFPEMGDYFRTHRDILPLDVRGLFSQLVLDVQEQGENPTAAFPSSHVGMSLVTVLLARQARNRWLFWILCFLFVVLFFATVYLKAHYAIDSLAGLVFGFLFFWITDRLFPHVSSLAHLKP
jgi:membrane-associated phospholipid phosphatase